MFYRTAIRTITIFNREEIKLPEEMKVIIRKAIAEEKTRVLEKLEYWKNSETDPALMAALMGKGYKELARIESYERRVKK